MSLKRRQFLVSTAGLALTGVCSGDETKPSALKAAWNKEISRHRVDSVKTSMVRMRWPRQVGKNSSKDVHGLGPQVRVCQIKTDRGAAGWGAARGDAKVVEQVAERIQGQSLSKLFDPAIGITSVMLAPLDFALHDLAGIILDVPVYKMLGGAGPKATPCYSGMIYFDDLEPPEKPAGIDRVLRNCQQDYDLGYRQLKVKIGRGNKWMPAAAGLQRDIEMTKAIAQKFPDVDILVDGNDGFTADELIQYLEGIGNVKLFWIEEPFRETVPDYRRVRQWLSNHNRNTLLADGEANPNWQVLDQLIEQRLLDVQLVDIVGHGFTPWRKLMPNLKQQKVQASPHAWGHLLKTHYVAHLAAGLANVVTIEGVTCQSDDVDFGGYRLEKGKLVVSDEAGFGMKLINKS